MASSIVLVLIVINQPRCPWLARLALVSVIIIGTVMLPDGFVWRRFLPLGVMAVALIMLTRAWSSWNWSKRIVIPLTVVFVSAIAVGWAWFRSD